MASVVLFWFVSNVWFVVCSVGIFCLLLEVWVFLD